MRHTTSPGSTCMSMPLRTLNPAVDLCRLEMRTEEAAMDEVETVIVSSVIRICRCGLLAARKLVRRSKYAESWPSGTVIIR